MSKVMDVLVTVIITRHINGNAVNETRQINFTYEGYNNSLNMWLDQLLADSVDKVQAGNEDQVIDIEIANINIRGN